MPVYVYRNLVTGDTFEVQQRMVDDALKVDPTTGDPVRRVIQPVGIAFKGSGFYVNDSRGGSKAASAAPATPDRPEAAGSAPATSTDDSAAASKAPAESAVKTPPAAPSAASSAPAKPAAGSTD